MNEVLFNAGVAGVLTACLVLGLVWAYSKL